MTRIPRLPLLLFAIALLAATSARADTPVDDEEELLDESTLDDEDDPERPNQRAKAGADARTKDATKRPAASERARPSRFVEASGAFGVQFGTTPYLPDGDGTTSHHPMTNGPAIGVSAGVELVDGLWLIANAEQTTASSRDGQVANALDNIDGVLEYRTIVAGLRSVRTIGPGRLFGELAAGVVLPFETQLQYVYAAPLGGLPVPVQGTGTKTDEYNLGFGAHGAFGYQIDVSSHLYVATAVKLKGFATTNSGRRTRLDNFVTDFAAPSPVTADVVYESGSMTPSTYSVQDLRAQLAVGLLF